MRCLGQGQDVLEELETSKDLSNNDKEEEDAAAVTALDRVRLTR